MIVFVFNSILLGVGLAMDAFSVSLANGLKEPQMRKVKMIKTAGVFGVFQTGMPLIGWLCVHTIASYFTAFQKAIPWIALILLGYIGGSMLKEGISGEVEEIDDTILDKKTLFIQGIATSIDALSVGFTIASYTWYSALISTVIIGVTTFVICMAGLKLGKIFGLKLADRATFFGGIILIFIGLEIFISNVFM